MLTYFEKYSKINNHIIYFTRDKILYIDIRINIELPFGGELLGKKQEKTSIGFERLRVGEMPPGTLPAA